MIKQNVLFSKMALYEDSIEDLAAYLRITRQTLLCKIKGRSEFKGSEINLIAARYHLTPEEICEIFHSN